MARQVGAPFTFILAADARLSQTNYLDDQSWELTLAAGDEPALALQSRYGSRVGLVSLVPMWQHDNRMIYETQTYAESPSVIAFAPGYVRCEAKLTPELVLLADYWVMESQAVGGRYTLTNAGSVPQTIRLDLFGHVGSERKYPSAILTLQDQTNALSLGRFPSFEPVVVLENANIEAPLSAKPSPKIGVSLTLEVGESVQVRWVHAGLRDMNASIQRAQFWLAQDWDAAFRQVGELAQAIPTLSTGNVDFDTTVAYSYQQLVQAFMRPTEHMPYPSFVATRQPSRGFSRRGDGSDYDRGWNGQSAQLAYLIGLAITSVDAELAQGIVHNYLAVQAEDGSVDSKPGLGGQREGMLCPPLLARLAWGIFQMTQDKEFLKAVYPRLVDFFNRWADEDLDADRDTLPEWQDERQMGYVFFPTFGSGQPWAQNLNIRQVETPDLAAYLLSEAVSLQKMAQILEDPGAYELGGRAADLRKRTNRLWYEDGARYAYHDRDTDSVSTKMVIVENGRADEEHLPARKLSLPARVIVQVEGGTGKVPLASLYLAGLDAQGQKIEETVDVKDFTWSYGNGFYTSRYVYSTVDRIRFEGLSRVYRIRAYTVDLTRLDINAVLPLMDAEISSQHRAALVKLLDDETHFKRQSGLTIVSAQDANFDPSSANGGGGTWVFWTTLVGEALIEHGQYNLAVDFLKRLLDTQTHVLKEQRYFSEFYHSDTVAGLGETGHVGGIVPLYLLSRILGVQIISMGRVWTGGTFAWESPVTVRQHGVTVKRSVSGTHIEFPSGHVVDLEAEAVWQLVVDPSVVAREPKTNLPAPPAPIAPSAANRVIIEIEPDGDNS